MLILFNLLAACLVILPSSIHVFGTPLGSDSSFSSNGLGSSSVGSAAALSTDAEVHVQHFDPSLTTKDRSSSTTTSKGSRSSSSTTSNGVSTSPSPLDSDFVQIDVPGGKPAIVHRYINRELSWVAFNERVLAEAQSPRHPLLERVRFLAISHSNLDEFMMVRVAGVTQLVRERVNTLTADALSPTEQLTAMLKGCSQLQVQQQIIWSTLRSSMEKETGIFIVSPSELSTFEMAFLKKRFHEEMWPQLTPQSVDPAHPFPFIPNKGMGLMFTLKKAIHTSSHSSSSSSSSSSSNHRSSFRNDENDRFSDSFDSNNDHVNSHHRSSGSGERDNEKARLPTEMKAILLIPPRLPRFVRLPDTVSRDSFQLNLTGSSHAAAAAGNVHSSDGLSPIRFILLEDVLLMFLDVFFSDFTVKEKGMFRILRDSEVEVDEEAVDLVKMFEKALKRRRKGVVIDLVVDSTMPEALVAFLAEKVGITRESVSVVNGLVGIADVKGLIVSDRKAHQFSDFEVRLPERVTRDFGGDIFAAIRAKDLIVHHPFESFETVLMFVRQAARDPNVVAIKQTLYRTSEDSPIVKELIEAAEAGKTVTALIELKARFDEEANIRWARDMERAGVHVVYGFVELKTHAKVALAVRKEDEGLRTYVHFGTGNYHPLTAKIYTDLSYFTASPALGRDANKIFNFMTGYGKPYDLELIAVAPVTLRSKLEELIRAEIENARNGLPSGIWVKVNALVDNKIINLLYEASEAGVQIDLIVRGMCALRPGVPGLSSNIRIKSIIGRFLEHSRIVVFANGTRWPSENAAVFMSSADWMTRNLDWRVEALVPLVNPTVHAQVLNEIMTNVIEDEVNSWRLQPDGVYHRVHDFKAKPTEQELIDEPDSHRYFMTRPSLSGRGKAKDPGHLTPRILTRQEREERMAAEGI
jgi:polyphosphate kinase